MKKIVFYIPLIVFGVFFSWIAITFGQGSFFSPIVFLWISLFFLAGFLLSKNMFWGGVLGMLPGIHFIYMSSNYRGQAINERPIGIVLLIFYIVCTGYVYKKNKRKPSNT